MYPILARQFKGIHYETSAQEQRFLSSEVELVSPMGKDKTISKQTYSILALKGKHFTKIRILCLQANIFRQVWISV